MKDSCISRFWQSFIIGWYPILGDASLIFQITQTKNKLSDPPHHGLSPFLKFQQKRTIIFDKLWKRTRYMT